MIGLGLSEPVQRRRCLARRTLATSGPGRERDSALKRLRPLTVRGQESRADVPSSDKNVSWRALPFSWRVDATEVLGDRIERARALVIISQ